LPRLPRLSWLARLPRLAWLPRPGHGRHEQSNIVWVYATFHGDVLHPMLKHLVVDLGSLLRLKSIFYRLLVPLKKRIIDHLGSEFLHRN
jgi:hypothetical protein